ncbi:hypothetical protein AB6A40_009947 [Gnathostoma spinigerum]|uniref:Uncharacterized protein n=1 Tax=Gnathostoma spinigerum TaxID=75299 RepID=A0ABD6ETV0_9BILA
MCEVSKKIAKMQKENGRSIKKSRYYFERRAEFARVLENQKSLILRLEAEVRQKKLDYTTSLRNLEHISDNIHEERSLGSSKRSGSMRQKVDDLSDSSRSDQGGRITEGEQEFRDRATLEDSIALENIKMKLDAMTAETDQKDTIDPSLFDDESATESLDSRDSRPDSLGTGVILLAQQLIGGHEKPKRTRVNPYILPAGASDFRYQTTLPEEISSTAESSPVDYSDSGSDSAISIKTPNIEQLSDMLRSHSQLEVQIEEHASDVAEMLHNVENDLDMKKSKFGKVISRCRNRLDPSALHLRAPSAYS